MKRLPNWHSALVAYLTRVARAEFEIGKMDCALFAAGAIKAMTGQDLAAPFATRYTTFRGGLRVLKRAGHASLVDLILSHFAEVPPAFAGVGDIALLDGDEGIALGIVHGEFIYVRRPGGLGLVSLRLAKRAFRV